MVKGGHGVGAPDAADDYLRMAGGESCVAARYGASATANTHGTGCSLSSAVACGLARGFSVDVAVRDAKAYVAGALGGRSEPGGVARALEPHVAATVPRCPARARTALSYWGFRASFSRDAVAAAPRIFRNSQNWGLTGGACFRNILTCARRFRAVWRESSVGVSSNGRTAVSGAVCEGSTPSTPAIFSRGISWLRRLAV